MLWTIFLFACSFALSLLLTPVLREFALRRSWVDKPDNDRKMHKVPIPRIGGVAIVLAYAGSLGILLLISTHRSLPVQEHFPLVWNLMSAALFVLVIGLLDDFVGLKPWHKVLGETLAAGLAYFGGIQIHSLAGHPLGTFLGLPLTMLWLIGCTNAFNLIDGLDGLATGIGLLAALTTAAAGLLHGNFGLLIVTAPLAGALLGFLVFNFNPASIFLGDGGSLWVGFMLACYGVIWSEKSVTALSITAPIMALAIPLLDTALSIVRRFLRRQPIFAADRGHIHHRLLDRGLTPRRAVLLLYAAGSVGAGFSLLQSTSSASTRSLIIAVFCGVVWVGIRHLGYREFSIAAALLHRNSLRSMVESQISLRQYEESLIAADSLEKCWCALQKIGRELKFTHVELRLLGCDYEEQLDKSANGHWILHVPLSDLEYVRLGYQFDASSGGPAIAPLADLLHRSLSAKVRHFRPQMIPNNGAIKTAEVNGILPPAATSVASDSSRLLNS